MAFFRWKGIVSPEGTQGVVGLEASNSASLPASLVPCEWLQAASLVPCEWLQVFTDSTLANSQEF